jgi:hypothetical protein
MRSGVVAILVGAGFTCACDGALAADANRINIDALVTATYDSNIARSNATIAAQRGISPEDFITAPSIAVDIRVPLSRQSVFLKGSVGYDFYARNTILNSANINLQGGANLLVRNCEATVSGSIDYAQSDLNQLNLAVTKNINNTTSVNLNGSCGGTVGFAPTLSLNQEWSNNSAPQLKQTNFRDFNVTAGLAYRRPLFGQLSAYFSYDDAAYPNRGLLALQLQNGYRNYGAGVRYERKFGARIEGDIKVGYTAVRPINPTVAGFDGVTFGGDVNFRFSRLLQAHLTFAREINPQILPGVSYGVENSFNGQITYSVGRKLSLAAGGSVESNNYRSSVNVPGQVASETIWDIFGSARYQLTRRIGFSLDYHHEQRDAIPTDFSYTDDRVELTISGRI